MNMTPSELFIKHNVFLAHGASVPQMVGSDFTASLSHLDKLDHVFQQDEGQKRGQTQIIKIQFY
jgi:hypothetical protein